jgi:hypothetical protein
VLGLVVQLVENRRRTNLHAGTGAGGNESVLGGCHSGSRAEACNCGLDLRCIFAADDAQVTGSLLCVHCSKEACWRGGRKDAGREGEEGEKDCRPHGEYVAPGWVSVPSRTEVLRGGETEGV